MNTVNRAANHPLTYTGSATSFFEGGLLGNGGLGVVVRTRPDAVLFHFGHNAIWDKRVCEDHKTEILPFQTLFEKVKEISPRCQKDLEEDSWYRDYNRKMTASYGKAYPRPLPCGTLCLFFDMRQYEILGHSIDISTGIMTVSMRGLQGRDVTLTTFADMQSDTLYFACQDCDGAPANPFTQIRLVPHRFDDGTPYPSPEWQNGLGYCQRIPLNEDCTPSDRDEMVALSVRVNCLPAPTVTEGRITMPDSGADFSGCACLQYGNADGFVLQAPSFDWEAALARTRATWEEYWSRSGVRLQRQELEQTWYHNQYFLRLVLRPGGVCPGLFGNFMFDRYGTAWHSDYHMNYNTQQPFWGCFITNHAELHEPYISLVEELLPLSCRWAEEQYGLPGAFFPHSAYKAPMTTFPYPSTVWGWEVCETPWTVQSLWWHYLYTGDVALLKNRLFEPIRQAVYFLVAYLQRADADFGDGAFHVFPTVPPELYSLKPGFVCNKDCIVDLTLIRFVFRAYLQAVNVLQCSDLEADTVAAVQRILPHLAEYPQSKGADSVLLSVAESDPDEIENVPNMLAPVFPGEDESCTDGENRELALRTWYRQRTEGGNELVFVGMQGARLGVLDLDAYTRHIQYNRHANGTLTDRATCSGGRYDDL